MRKLLSTLALAALMAGAATSAQAIEGWYGRADIGSSVEGEVDVSFYDGEETFSDTADLDDGWMADVGVGYAYGNGFRAELELAERNNEVSSSSINVDARSLMVNGFYDFNRGGRFQPYVGVGVGYAKVDADTVDDSNWAWQALAGIGMEINDRLTLDVGYRYFNVDELEFASVADASYTHQAVTVGLRFQFAAAAAPPPPPPPPPPPLPPPPPPPVVCPASDFVVYFEWDRSNLNQAALDVIDQAVARARQCNVAGIVVVGHTDTSGSTRYNVGLSERRSSVVRDALVARGLATGSIRTEARGETDLARATRDGVREPLNRRTAVTISSR